MSLITIDQFQGIHLDTSEDITVYFNNVTGAISYTSSGPGSVFQEFSPERADGRSITSMPLADGTKMYNLVESTIAPYATVSSITDITPLPPQCDLKLTASVSNETSKGGNNGSVVLTATTSFGPVQYSLDGVAGSGTFNNIAPGTHQASATDANGCTASLTVTVEAYLNPFGEIGATPQVEVSPGNLSNWNAAFNPVIFSFQNTLDPSKKNFRIELEITSEKGVVVGSWSPDTTGKTVCNISVYLRALVSAKDDFSYDVISYNDINRFSAFSVRYREVWDDGSNPWFSAPSTFYVTFSAKQLGDLYGGNMAEYVTFPNEPNPSYKAKFLTLFEEPTAWVGLPFDTAFIFSENLAGTQVKLRTTSLDINKNPTGVASPDYLLESDTDPLLSSAVDNIIVGKGELAPVTYDTVPATVGVNRLMLAGSPAANTEYFQIQLYTGSDDAPNFITQQLIIQTVKPCNDPYVYIKWLNTLGGWDYWRFGYDQVTQLNTTDGISIDRKVFDWTNNDTIADTISKTAYDKITVGAVVPNNKIKGLKGLHTSVKIQMLVNLNPYKWQTVILNTGSFDIKRAKTNFSELKFTLSMPEINIQTQ